MQLNFEELPLGNITAFERIITAAIKGGISYYDLDDLDDFLLSQVNENTRLVEVISCCDSLIRIYSEHRKKTLFSAVRSSNRKCSILLNLKHHLWVGPPVVVYGV